MGANNADLHKGISVKYWTDTYTEHPDAQAAFAARKTGEPLLVTAHIDGKQVGEVSGDGVVRRAVIHRGNSKTEIKRALVNGALKAGMQYLPHTKLFGEK